MQQNNGGMWNGQNQQQMFSGNGFGFDPTQAGFQGMGWDSSNGFNPMMGMAGGMMGFNGMMGK